MKLLKGAIARVGLLPRQLPALRRHRRREGPHARGLAPGLAAGRGERARLAVARRDRRRRQGAVGPDRVRRDQPEGGGRRPDADAYSNTYVQKAVDALKAGGMDVTGSSYKAPEVTLKEGGK